MKEYKHDRHPRLTKFDKYCKVSVVGVKEQFTWVCDKCGKEVADWATLREHRWEHSY